MRQIALIELIIVTILLVPGFVFSLLVAGFAPMAFDAPGSTKRPRVWLLFIAFFSSPVVIGIAVVGGWSLYLHGLYPIAIGVSLLPLLNILAAAAVFAWPDR